MDNGVPAEREQQYNFAILDAFLVTDKSFCWEDISNALVNPKGDTFSKKLESRRIECV